MLNVDTVVWILALHALLPGKMIPLLKSVQNGCITAPHSFIVRGLCVSVVRDADQIFRNSFSAC